VIWSAFTNVPSETFQKAGYLVECFGETDL